MYIQCTSRIFPNLFFLMFQRCFQDLLSRCPETFDVTLSDYMCLAFSVEVYVCCLNVFEYVAIAQSFLEGSFVEALAS